MHIEIPLESFINLHFALEHKRAFSTTAKTDIHIMIQKVFMQLTNPAPALSRIYAASWKRSSSIAFWNKEIFKKIKNKKKAKKEKSSSQKKIPLFFWQPLFSYIPMRHHSANGIIRSCSCNGHLEPRSILIILCIYSTTQLWLLPQNENRSAY